MKTVYADVVIIYNFLIDYMILYLTARFLNIKAAKKRLMLSAFAGAVFSLFCVLCISSYKLTAFAAIAFLPIMCLICFGRMRMIFLLRICISMYLYSIILSGTMVSVSCVLYGQIRNGTESAISAVIALFLLLYSSKHIRSGLLNYTSAERVETRIVCDGKNYDYILLADSGNLLTDPYNKLPVIVLGEKERLRIAKEMPLRIMPLRTVVGKKLVNVFTPDKVQINNKQVEASVCFVKDENLGSICADGLIPKTLI